MQSLFDRASRVDVAARVLPGGETVPLRQLHVRFGHATPEFLKPGTLAESYTRRPLVTFNGAPYFGELAVLKWLETDEWTGVWVDVEHGRALWREMPHRSAAVALPVAQQALFDAIVQENGGRASGFFSVMAWRGAQVIFVRYTGDGSPPARHEEAWIAAALRAGVSPHDMLVVCAEAPHPRAW